MARLNKEREEKLEPIRMDYAIGVLNSLGFTVNCSNNEKELQFYFKDEIVRFWPYSGFFNGKSVKSGRGIKNLLNQLK